MSGRDYPRPAGGYAPLRWLGRRVVASLGPLILALCPPLTQAQTPDSEDTPPDLAAARVQVGFRGLLGFPLGEFDDHVDLSAGIGGNFSYRIADRPLRLGGGMDVVWYGRQHRRVPLSGTIPDVLVDVTTSSGILNSHGLLRLQAVDGRARPYAEGLIGFNYVFTQTTVDLDDDVFFEHRRVTTTNHRDFAFSFGGGAGMTVDLSQWSDGRFGLDLGARYVFGGSATYLAAQPDLHFMTVDDLRRRHTRTDMLVVVLGGFAEF